MPNWILLSILTISYGICSPFWSFETLPGDIRYGKLTGASFYEVKVIRVDSLRTIKRFWTGDVHSGITKDSTPSSHAIFHTSYQCQFEVIRNLAGVSRLNTIPLVAVDSRGSAETIWNRIWTKEKRQGKTFILILEKNGQVRAFYHAATSINWDDDRARAWRKSLSEEMNELLKNKDCKGYIYTKNLEKLFEREGFSLD